MAPNNPLPIWGNEKTMNLNPLILTNIQSSPYFKVNLYELKTYHEVIDEIYYRVDHLEPWEKGSRKTAGQTGMCGGVRGVGAGGIVSSAYCLLYKLFTLRLTRKQVNGLITHADSPYIRGLGFMYIRYTQDPKELWDWFEPYLDDEEEIDVKAGGGHKMIMGQMVRQWLVKLEWYSTLFPRIPVPVQKTIMEKLKEHPTKFSQQEEDESSNSRKGSPRHIPDGELSFGEAEKHAQRRPSPPPPQRRGSPPIKRPSKTKSRSKSPRHRSPRHTPPRRPRSPYRRRSPPRIYRPRSPPRHQGPPMDDFARELEKERARQRREKEREMRRSRSPKRRSRSRSRSKERKKRRSRSRSRDKKHSHRSSHDKHSRHSSEHKKT